MDGVISSPLPFRVMLTVQDMLLKVLMLVSWYHQKIQLLQHRNAYVPVIIVWGLNVALWSESEVWIRIKLVIFSRQNNFCATFF